MYFVRVYYPVLLDLKGQRALVVGGGTVAARKAKGLAEAGAELTVVSPMFCAAITRWRGVVRRRRSFRAGDLKGVRLVVCASNDPAIQERVYRLCEKRGIPVNVVDAPHRCTFIVPARVRRGPLTICVSTDGASPGLSRSLRLEIERNYPPAFARLVRAIERHRRRILKTQKDAKRRAAVLRRIASPQIVATLRRQGIAAALKLVNQVAQTS